MRISRRMFLGAVAAGPALARTPEPQARCAVLDLGCILPESLAGFRSQAGGIRHADAQVLIVPGVGELRKARHSRMVQDWLDRGRTVLMELASGERVSSNVYFPYVEYSWPVQVKIREFAPVGLDPMPGDQVIATFRGQPVGLRRAAGTGTLVTLGSPLGPMFRTGDPDAHLLLAAFLNAPPATDLKQTALKRSQV